MNFRECTENGNKIVIIEVTDQEKVIIDTQSALDLLMTIRYEHDTDRLALDKKAIAEDFFILSTGIAGEILQKFMNYSVKMAVYGDFSQYTSKPLKDFIRESNKGKNFFFVSEEQEAIQKLSVAD